MLTTEQKPEIKSELTETNDISFRLSNVAQNELRVILQKEFGENATQFSNDDVNRLGIRLLKLTATVLKGNVIRSS